jgi:hypothetical protein
MSSTIVSFREAKKSQRISINERFSLVTGKTPDEKMERADRGAARSRG